MTNGQEQPALSEKEQELIAVGVSIASGCLPSTSFHVRAASRVGADEDEILQAVRDGMRVRMAATAIMARAGGLPPTEIGEPSADAKVDRSQLRGLVSLCAAYAASCPTSLEAHADAARALGASDQQLFDAIRIACALKNVAGSKVKSAAAAVFGEGEASDEECDCAEEDASYADRPVICSSGPGGSSTTCSCGTDSKPKAEQ